MNIKVVVEKREIIALIHYVNLDSHHASLRGKHSLQKISPFLYLEFAISS